MSDYPSYHLGDPALAELHASCMGPNGYIVSGKRYWCVHRALGKGMADMRYLQQIEYGHVAPRTIAEEIRVDGQWRRIGPSTQQVKT